MAPNVRVIHPQDEVLVQPRAIPIPHSHGTQKVISNYPKQEVQLDPGLLTNPTTSAPLPITTHRSGIHHKDSMKPFSPEIYEVSFEDDSREFLLFKERPSRPSRPIMPDKTSHKESLLYIEEIINKYPEAFQTYMTENHPPAHEFESPTISDSEIQESKTDSITSTVIPQTKSPRMSRTKTTTRLPKAPRTPRKTPALASLESSGTTLDKSFHRELPNAPNLHHHEKSLAELSQNDIAIRDDSHDMSAEARTAIILVGMCTIIMMLICFLFMVGKWKDKKLKKKLPPKETPVKPKQKSIWDTTDNAFVRSTLAVATPPVLRIPYGVQTSKPKTYLSPFKGVEVSQAAQVGCLWFSARYDTEKSDLHLSVLHARYPHGRDMCDEPGDLFIEALVITPMNKVKASAKTTPRRATRSPVFNHSFSFLILEEDIKSCILKFVLHDKHPEKGDILAGTVIMPFSSVDIYAHDIYCRDFL